MAGKVKSFIDVVQRAKGLETEAHKLFGTNETSKSRIITLDQSYANLDQLSVQQDDLLRQSLRCVEEEVYRAAHVMAWAAFVDYLEEFAAEDGFQK